MYVQSVSVFCRAHTDLNRVLGKGNLLTLEMILLLSRIPENSYRTQHIFGNFREVLILFLIFLFSVDCGHLCGNSTMRMQTFDSSS